MKNVFATTATIAALFAGSAAFAEGGYVDGNDFINAEPANGYSEVKHENANALERKVTTNERNISGTATATVFVTASAASAQGVQGR